MNVPGKLLVIGAWYTYFGERVQIREVDAYGPNVTVESSAARIATIDKSELGAMTHMPCPYCGEMQPLRLTTGGVPLIDLAEHIARNHV